MEHRVPRVFVLPSSAVHHQFGKEYLTLFRFTSLLLPQWLKLEAIENVLFHCPYGEMIKYGYKSFIRPLCYTQNEFNLDQIWLDQSNFSQ